MSFPCNPNVIPVKTGIQRGRDGVGVGKTNFGMELGQSKKQYYVCILASKRNGALCMGVTSDPPKRVYQQKNDLVAGFTQKYRVHDLAPASWGYR